MEIIVAKTAGFCFGVRRALEMVEDALKHTEAPIFSLGPLIHNPRVVRDLERQGLRSVGGIEEVAGEKVVICSHGAGPEVYRYASENKLALIDATCPFVKNVQELAVILIDQDYQVIIIGEREHAEVKGVLDSIGGAAAVVNNKEDLANLKFERKVGIISQTTQEIAKFREVAAEIFPRVKECRIFNTICLATRQRQQEAAELSRSVDVMVVVGGKNSANTCRLAEICAKNGASTYHLESAAELKAEFFRNAGKVGITAGASTPDEQITEIINKIKAVGGCEGLEDTNLNRETAQNENEDEEQFRLDLATERFQHLEEGRIIEAKVILVRDSEAYVDIGGKSDLFIPLEELTNEPVTSAKEVVKAGDVIKVMVVRNGDGDGLRLSKRRVEQERVWADLNEAFKTASSVEATVTEEVKGGLGLKINGIKAFMPASQAGLGYIKNLAELVGQSFPVRILEFDRVKRRVVVSRRIILEEARKLAEAEFFNTVAEGDRKRGKVIRITDFGVFVDLGAGVEGLIHISEISWNRVKSAREVLTEGDEVEVLVTKVDREKMKIGLSLKQLQTHPWVEAIKEFTEGGIYRGTVVRLESFGAFIRLRPGLDGLAHISQLSEKRIGKPDELLKVGDEVNVKILKIDYDNRKVSLSLKQVTEDQTQKEYGDFLEAQDEEPITQNLGELLNQ